MTVLPFPIIRGAELQQGKTACSVRPIVSRISAGGRYGFYNGPVTAKIPLPAFSLTARHPRHIVVRGQNDNRFIISQALAGEERADYCCNLSSLTIRGAITDDLKNFCRSFGRPATLLSALLQACKQSCSRVYVRSRQSFHLYVLRHGNHHERRSFVSVQKDFGEVTNV